MIFGKFTGLIFTLTFYQSLLLLIGNKLGKIKKGDFKNILVSNLIFCCFMCVVLFFSELFMASQKINMWKWINPHKSVISSSIFSLTYTIGILANALLMRTDSKKEVFKNSIQLFLFCTTLFLAYYQVYSYFDS